MRPLGHDSRVWQFFNCAHFVGVYSLIDFTGVEADSGRLFFIPSSKCYNAGEEFIENVLEVLVDSIEKKLDNYQPMQEMYLRYCNISAETKVTSTTDITTANITSKKNKQENINIHLGSANTAYPTPPPQEKKVLSQIEKRSQLLQYSSSRNKIHMTAS